MKKPWREVDINDRWKFLHSSFPDDKNDSNDDIDAFSVLQEGNQGGHFYRVVSWCGTNRYCSVWFDSHGGWHFDLHMKDFKNNKVVKFLPTNKLYKVVHSETFYNILEKYR
jgi:hypothetical protein